LGGEILGEYSILSILSVETKNTIGKRKMEITVF
jgi:hypothetical protein